MEISKNVLDGRGQAEYGRGMENNPVIRAILAAAAEEGSSLRKVALAHGLSKTHLHDVVHGRRDVSLRVGGAFGFEWSDRGWIRVKGARG